MRKAASRSSALKSPAIAGLQDRYAKLLRWTLLHRGWSVVGIVLIAEGFGQHVPKGYVYFGMAFSLAVEMLNIRLRKRSAKPVDLHSAYEAPPERK